ncbi:MAG: transcriptional regulator, BadM/Rrf2 family [Ramlibacter sp.]|jgi:Rrf2 family nitric oxide-sensitive transcriptional repressor|nr:transcriptional regulator, BadM/Rrf2 family [Ramlibacter sp.]
MKLTAFTDYSLRVLIYLAAQAGGRATISQVAAAYGISENHLVKVVHFLGKAGWLKNVRGKGGGLELGRPADQIRIADVVRDAEGATAAAACIGKEDEGCRIATCCKLRGVLGEAMAAFYAVLARYTLADVARNRDQLATILFLPVPSTTPARKRA